MKIYIISLFPEMIEGVLHTSMLKKAQDVGAVSFELINLRQFGLGPRRQVDDMPYGGGDGMVLRPEPIISATESVKEKSPDASVILPTPRGRLYQQSTAKKIAKNKKDLIIICPRYEGYDERIVEYVDEQYSIGNYILTGGEIPAMVIVDSVVRLLPDVLGGDNSVENESFQADDKTKEHPHYTRPEEFRGKTVPKVLLSGNHSDIERWRREHQI